MPDAISGIPSIHQRVEKLWVHAGKHDGMFEIKAEIAHHVEHCMCLDGCCIIATPKTPTTSNCRKKQFVLEDISVRMDVFNVLQHWFPACGGVWTGAHGFAQGTVCVVRPD